MISLGHSTKMSYVCGSRVRESISAVQKGGPATSRLPRRADNTVRCLDFAFGSQATVGHKPCSRPVYPRQAKLPRPVGLFSYGAKS